jgi:glycosyltransferase involved in cell wall biosynthesis
MFVTNFLPHVGGLEYYVDDLSKTLNKYWNDEIHIVCFDDKESMFEFNGIYNVHRIKRVVSIAGVFAIPNPFSLFRVLKKIQLRVGQFDLVWTHTRFFVSAILGLVYAKLFRLKTLHVEHGSSYVAHSNPLISFCSRIWDQTLGRIVLTFADSVIALSPLGLNFARSLGAKKPIFVPCVIEMAPWLPSIDRYEMPERPVLLFVGRLQPGKGVDNLLKALVDSCFSNTQLIVIGDGPSREGLEQQTEMLGLCDRVRFLGKIPRAEIPKWHASSSIFVNPSLSEGAPTTVLEALAGGLPVVSTRVGCCEHYLAASGNHGVLVDGMTPQDLKEALQIAISGFKVQDRSNCSMRIQESFEWKNVAAKLRAFGEETSLKPMGSKL